MAKVFLDLDGTLLDARPRQVAVASYALRRVNGQELDEAAFWQLKRQGATTLEALERLGHDHCHLVAQRWRQDIEHPRWLVFDQLLPGVEEALVRLPAWHIITARDNEDGLAKHMQQLGWEQAYTRVWPENAAQQKAEVLQAMTAQAFIGDSESDGRAAQIADVPFVAVSTGQRSADYLRSHGFVVADCMEQALGLLADSIDI